MVGLVLISLRGKNPGILLLAKGHAWDQMSQVGAA